MGAVYLVLIFLALVGPFLWRRYGERAIVQLRARRVSRAWGLPPCGRRCPLRLFCRRGPWTWCRGGCA